jgi:hypothetical protein
MIRLLNRIFALLFGSALVAAAFVTLVNGILAWARGDFAWIPGREWLRAFRSTTWSAPMVIGVAAAVGTFGALLVVIETWPQRPRLLAYETRAAGDWRLTRRSAETHLERRLMADLPTAGVKARLDAGASGWTLKISARAGASARPALESGARAQLVRLHAPPASRVRLRIAKAARGADLSVVSSSGASP